MVSQVSSIGSAIAIILCSLRKTYRCVSSIAALCRTYGYTLMVNVCLCPARQLCIYRCSSTDRQSEQPKHKEAKSGEPEGKCEREKVSGSEMGCLQILDNPHSYDQQTRC